MHDNLIHLSSDTDVLFLAYRVEEQAHWERTVTTRMWANAQRDGRPAEHR